MKYIEELSSGQSFLYNNQYYFITSDYKKDGSRLAYTFENGYPQWFKADVITDSVEVYTLDKNNNIIPLKITPKDEYSKTTI